MGSRGHGERGEGRSLFVLAQAREGARERDRGGAVSFGGRVHTRRIQVCFRRARFLGRLRGTLLAPHDATFRMTSASRAAAPNAPSCSRGYPLFPSWHAHRRNEQKKKRKKKSSRLIHAPFLLFSGCSSSPLTASPRPRSLSLSPSQLIFPSLPQLFILLNSLPSPSLTGHHLTPARWLLLLLRLLLRGGWRRARGCRSGGRRGGGGRGARSRGL